MVGEMMYAIQINEASHVAYKTRSNLFLKILFLPVLLFASFLLTAYKCSHSVVMAAPKPPLQKKKTPIRAYSP
jgi:hypothetical protein